MSTRLSLVAARVGLTALLTGSTACEARGRMDEPAVRPPNPASVEAIADPGDIGPGDRTVYDAGFGPSSRLVIVETHVAGDGSCCTTLMRAWLVDRTDTTRRTLIDSIADHYEVTYAVSRVTASAIVMCRTESHGMADGCVALFVDPVARRASRTTRFDRGRDLTFADHADAQRRLGVTSPELDRLRERSMFEAKPEDAVDMAEVFATHPLPQSTDEQYARARGASGDHGRTIQEEVGAWQADTGGVWFGKSFYEGEGFSGVGDIGFLSDSGRYSFLGIPELTARSVEALFVEPDVIWAGLVMHAEYGSHPGGLLRFDRRTRRSTIHPVPARIQRILTVGDAVFLRTSEGVHVLRAGRLVWHHMEPTPDGGFAVVTDTVPRSTP